MRKKSLLLWRFLRDEHHLLPSCMVQPRLELKYLGSATHWNRRFQALWIFTYKNEWIRNFALREALLVFRLRKTIHNVDATQKYSTRKTLWGTGERLRRSDQSINVEKLKGVQKPTHATCDVIRAI